MRCLPAACVLSAALLLASEAAAGSRVSLLGFEGDSAAPIRWRVAQILKRAGHVVVGFKPPRDPDSRAQLRAFAKRRRVDAFVAGSSVETEDGWQLSLVVRDAEGQRRGSTLKFTAPSLGELVKELKTDGQGRLDRVVKGKKATRTAASESDSESAGADIDMDAPADADAMWTQSVRSKKNIKKPKGKKRRAELRRAAEEPPATKEKAIKKLRAAKEREAAEAADEPLDDAVAEAIGAAPERKRTKNRAGSEPAPASDDAPVLDEEPAPSEDAPVPREEAAATDEDTRSLVSEESSADDNSEADRSTEVGADEGASGSDGAGANGVKAPTLIMGVKAGMVRRTLTYADDLYARLPEPSANAYVYQLRALVYPFARPVKDRLGLVASYESAFSGSVRDNAQDTNFAVNFSELFAGLLFRQPFGKHELGLQAGFGTLQAGLDDPEGQSRVPELDYTLLRSSVDLGLHFGKTSVHGSVGYRLPLGGYGEAGTADWFPRMDGYGFDGSLGLAYRVTPEVAVDFSGSLRRFILSMNSQPEDAVEGRAEVAGGAVDQYLTGYFGLNITL